MFLVYCTLNACYALLVRYRARPPTTSLVSPPPPTAKWKVMTAIFLSVCTVYTSCLVIMKLDAIRGISPSYNPSVVACSAGTLLCFSIGLIVLTFALEPKDLTVQSNDDDLDGEILLRSQPVLGIVIARN